jgi:hypothetical protein
VKGGFGWRRWRGVGLRFSWRLLAPFYFSSCGCLSLEGRGDYMRRRRERGGYKARYWDINCESSEFLGLMFGSYCNTAVTTTKE